MGLPKVERHHEKVPLFTNADNLRIRDLERELEKAAVAAGPSRLNDDPVKDAAKAYDDYKAEALERAVVVGMTAMPSQELRALLAAHPPRQDLKDPEGELVESYPQDQREGCNVDTIARPILLASLDLDQFDDEAERDEWVDALSGPDFNRLVSSAFSINAERGADPKWSASSWLDQTSSAMSRSAETSTEASAPSSDSPMRIGDSSEQSG